MPTVRAPLADFQWLQVMLADMAVAGQAARLLTHAAAEEIEAGAPTMSAEIYVGTNQIQRIVTARQL